jgi:hypothetical protein
MQRATQIIRGSSCAGFVVLLIAGVSGTAIATAQSPGTFTATGSMTTARAFHTATLLANGTVLIAGGRLSNPSLTLASAELYDSAAGTFKPTGSMTTARWGHTATLLPDGRVLIAGGSGRAEGGGAVASAELYDPSTGTFTATKDMIAARGMHTAILLPNGKVLLVGGYGTSAYPDIPAAELYDPATGIFTPGGSYVGRGGCDFCAPAILLPDGRVLFPGQYPVQLYDPMTNSFGPGGMMIDDHSTATLLTNGKVLFAGGEGYGRLSSAELYDPARGTFASTGNMAFRRVWHTLTLLPNGMALTTGGETDSCAGNVCQFAGISASAELYDPSAGSFIATGNMAWARDIHTATLLNDGRVLVAGGNGLASAELYNPDVLVPALALVSLSGDGQGPGAIFHAGTSAVASPDDPAVAGEVLEIYCNGLSSESVIPPQVAIGGRMAEIVSFGNAPGPGFSGVNQVNVRVPSGVAPGPAIPVRLTYIGRPSNEVTIAVQ